MNQYTEPPQEFTSVPLDELYPLGVYPVGRTAGDPQLVIYANEEGYIEAILPETSGPDPSLASVLFFFVGVLLALAVRVLRG